MLTQAPAIDYREALRFIAAGGIATLGNVAAVMIARRLMPFEGALVCGIVAGMTASFLLSKLFAFRSRSWSHAKGEAGRFLIVYCCGLLVYYLVAIAVAETVAQFFQPHSAAAELAGVLAGAGTMLITGYFGHRFFTYRTGRNACP